MVLPDTYGCGEQRENDDLSLWVQGKEQGSEQKSKWFRLKVGEQAVYNGLQTKTDGQIWIKKEDIEMPQHWLGYMMQPWEKDLKKWRCMAVPLLSWLCRNLNRARSA